MRPTWNKHTERDRNLGDHLSMFDSSTHKTIYPKFYDQPTLTHKYQNNAQKQKKKLIIQMYTRFMKHSNSCKHQPMDTKKDKETAKQKEHTNTNKVMRQ